MLAALILTGGKVLCLLTDNLLLLLGRQLCDLFELLSKRDFGLGFEDDFRRSGDGDCDRDLDKIIITIYYSYLDAKTTG